LSDSYDDAILQAHGFTQAMRRLGPADVRTFINNQDRRQIRQGCVHNRVNFDFKSPAGIAKWRAFMDDAMDWVIRYEGSLSGEHGDGQARGRISSLWWCESF